MTDVKVPETFIEASTAISARSDKLRNISVIAVAAELAMSWLSAVREQARAEPKLRPVSEKPTPGAWVVVKTKMPEGSQEPAWRTLPFQWSAGCGFSVVDDVWLLLESAPPRTLADEARELGEPPRVTCHGDTLHLPPAVQKWIDSMNGWRQRIIAESAAHD